MMLIQLRAERQWTQVQLAEKAGVNVMSIYKMEHGQPVSQESAEKVLAVLGVNADEVAGLVFSKPLSERVNRAFVQGAHSQKESIHTPFFDGKGRQA